MAGGSSIGPDSGWRPKADMLLHRTKDCEVVGRYSTNASVTLVPTDRKYAIICRHILMTGNDEMSIASWVSSRFRGAVSYDNSSVVDGKVTVLSAMEFIPVEELSVLYKGVSYAVYVGDNTVYDVYINDDRIEKGTPCSHIPLSGNSTMEGIYRYTLGILESRKQKEESEFLEESMYMSHNGLTYESYLGRHNKMMDYRNSVYTWGGMIHGNN